jgi:NitT/TauT family transport system permease protein
MRFAIREQIDGRTDLLIGAAGIVTALLLWCLLTYGGLVQTIFLPTPSSIWQALVDFQQRHWLFPATWHSVWRVAKSLALVILIGVPIGVCMGAFAPVDALLRKIVNGGKSVPTTGIVGLIVLWFSVEERAKIVFLVLGAIFYMIVLVRNAVLAVDQEYLHVALDLGANRWQLLVRVLFPGALPQICEAIAVCNAIMWTYIVLAEFINSSEEQIGLGYLLYIGSRTQESAKVFASLIVIAVISSLTDFFLHTGRKKFLDW